MATALDPYSTSELQQRAPAIPGLDDPTGGSPALASHLGQVTALQHNQLANQQAQVDAQKQAELRNAASEISTYATGQHAGKGWSAIPQELRQHFATSYPHAVADIPGLFNAQQSAATGRPVGANITQDDIASGEAGGVKFSQLAPTPQPDADGQGGSSNRDALIQGFVSRQLPLSALPRSGPQKAQIIGAIMRADPTWTPQDYEAQNKARESFVGQGKNAQAILSANTLVNHLGQAADLIDGMDTTRAPLWNSVSNAISESVGGPHSAQIGQYRAAAQTAATEYAKMLSGGIPGQQEIKAYEKLLDPSLGPAQLRANILQMAHAMGERLKNLQNEWQTSVKAQRDVPFLTGNSPQVLQKLGVNPAELDPVGAKATGQPTPPALPPAAQTQQPVAQQLPTIATKHQFDALPKGSAFIGSDGKRYNKP